MAGTIRGNVTAAQTLGPFWITLATAIFITIVTFVYSGLFNQDVEKFLPFIASGLMV